MPPPTMKRSTRYFLRLPPALSTSCTKGSLCASAISCARISFWPGGGCVGEREFLRTDQLLAGERLHRAGTDARVVGGDHAAHARDVADAHDQCAARDAGGRVAVFDAAVARQRHQFEKGAAWVQQMGEPFTGQQLAALVKVGSRT